MAVAELDMRKIALALLVTVAALPAVAENLPIVVRGNSSSASEGAPAPQPQAVTVCWMRSNSIGNLPYRHCTTVEQIKVELPR